MVADAGNQTCTVSSADMCYVVRVLMVLRDNAVSWVEKLPKGRARSIRSLVASDKETKS